MTTVVDIEISETSYHSATEQVRVWALVGESRTVYATGVHGLMVAHDSPDFKALLNRADMITPDGMPLVWMLRLKGQPGQERVYGPTLMLHVLEMATREKLPVGFYGGDEATLEKLVLNLKERFAGLKIAYAYSPPFRPLDEAEGAQINEEIRESGTRILFVGLGCPRQESWIDRQRGQIPAVMLGVGAAFDFHAGRKAQAPGWMQKMGLEWFFRLRQEPRRLWRRYLYNNPRFIGLALVDLIRFHARKGV
ncbi:MAG TPA: WecB/TagA/CpsF family glycosyltransferase [Anaerolineales bacterium]|jgi:N-acetylglucosaminyldiphosphoundecaprenol N-acetyl-beta-D-mannosaminyltransferase